jgi:predicted MFS family arabinose efflux permease
LSWTLAAYGIAGIAGTFAGERAGSRDIRATFLGVAVLMGVTIFLAACLSAFPVVDCGADRLLGSCFRRS